MLGIYGHCGLSFDLVIDRNSNSLESGFLIIILCIINHKVCYCSYDHSSIWPLDLHAWWFIWYKTLLFKLSCKSCCIIISIQVQVYGAFKVYWSMLHSLLAHGSSCIQGPHKWQVSFKCHSPLTSFFLVHLLFHILLCIFGPLGLVPLCTLTPLTSCFMGNSLVNVSWCIGTCFLVYYLWFMVYSKCTFSWVIVDIPSPLVHML